MSKEPESELEIPENPGLGEGRTEMVGEVAIKAVRPEGEENIVVLEDATRETMLKSAGLATEQGLRRRVTNPNPYSPHPRGH